MRSVKQMLLALTLGCATLFAAPFASAGHYYDRHDRGGVAVGLAVLIGIAALAASYDDDDYRHRGHYRNYDRGYRNRGYDHGYYNRGYRERGYRGQSNHPWRGYDRHNGYRRDRRW